LVLISSAVNARVATTRGCSRSQRQPTKRRLSPSTSTMSTLDQTMRCAMISSGGTCWISLKYAGATPQSTKAASA
jgi:hypothetical protein